MTLPTPLDFRRRPGIGPTGIGDRLFAPLAARGVTPQDLMPEAQGSQGPPPVPMLETPRAVRPVYDARRAGANKAAALIAAAVGAYGAATDNAGLTGVGLGITRGAQANLDEMDATYQRGMERFYDQMEKGMGVRNDARMEDYKAKLAAWNRQADADARMDELLAEDGFKDENEEVRHRNELGEIGAREEADLSTRKAYEEWLRSLPPTYDDQTERMNAEANQRRSERYGMGRSSGGSSGGGSRSGTPRRKAARSFEDVQDEMNYVRAKLAEAYQGDEAGTVKQSEVAKWTNKAHALLRELKAFEEPAASALEGLSDDELLDLIQ